MSNGGYKGASPTRKTSPEQYPGVWELTEQFQAQADGNWPFQETDCAPKSLRFNSADSAELTRSVNREGDRKTWTWSGWVKRHKFGVVQRLFSVAGAATNNDHWFALVFLTDDQLYLGGYSSFFRSSGRVLRDPSAWMHVHVVADLNNTVSSEKLRIYINGERSDDGTGSEPSLTGINDNVTHHLGSENSGNFCDVSLSEVQFIDGQALEPDAFTFVDGQGILQPKRFTGDYSSGPVYSNDVTGTGISSTVSNLFDGSTSTTVDGTAATVITFTPSTPIPYSSSVEVYTASSQTVRTYSLNGGSGVTNVANNWTSLATGSGTITSISQTPNSGYTHSWSAIRVDGQILVDASVGRNSFKLDFSDGAKDQSGLGNDWNALNLNLGGDFTYSSAHGSNVTTAEFAKMVDSDLNTYGEASGDFIGFAFAGEKITFKIQNTAQDAKLFYVQPATNTSFNFVNGGTWSVSGGSASGNQWTLNANSTETGTFTVPSNYVGTGRIYFSGNNTDFRVYDISPASDTESTKDILVDSPVNGNEASTGAGGERRGNYCTLNPLDRQSTNGTLSNGNLDLTQTGTPWAMYRGTIFVSSGKYYWECTLGNNQYSTVGICTDVYQMASSTGIWVNGSTEMFGYYPYNGYKYNGGSSASYATADTTASGSVIGVALDMDNGTLTFYKDGTSLGTAYTGLTGKNVSPTHWLYAQSNADSYNFGQRSFLHNVPAGFSPLATSFLPEPTIKRSDEAMDTALWTGNGATQKIDDFRFSPDLVWLSVEMLGITTISLTLSEAIQSC